MRPNHRPPVIIPSRYATRPCRRRPKSKMRNEPIWASNPKKTQSLTHPPNEPLSPTHPSGHTAPLGRPIQIDQTNPFLPPTQTKLSRLLQFQTNPCHPDPRAAEPSTLHLYPVLPYAISHPNVT